jgi:hypothetical protein
VFRTDPPEVPSRPNRPAIERNRERIGLARLSLVSLVVVSLIPIQWRLERRALLVEYSSEDKTSDCPTYCSLFMENQQIFVLNVELFKTFIEVLFSFICEPF